MAKKTPKAVPAKATATPRRKAAPTVMPVVGMGASAGGLEAFRTVLQGLPVDTGMAFVLIQHLDPKHDSMLVDILAKSTSMPVLTAREGDVVAPNRVYIIPPNANLEILQGVLRLTAREPGRGVNMPVDCFFRSLAADRGELAIGVILSGTSSDGSLGVEAIKGAGGMTLAQDSTAKYDGMPRSAIATGCIDFTLPPDGIARELARISRHPYLMRGAEDSAESAEAGDVWSQP